MLVAEFLCKKGCGKNYRIARDTAEEIADVAVKAGLVNAGTTASDIYSAGLRYTHYMQMHYKREGKASASVFETDEL